MRIDSWRQAKRTAGALALAVSAVEHAAHAGVAGPLSLRAHAAHVLGDAVLLAPLALAAVLVARRSSSRIGRAFITAAALSLALIPAASVHARLEQSSHSHVSVLHPAGLAHAASDAPRAFVAALAVALAAGAFMRRRRPSLALRRFAPAWAAGMFALVAVAGAVVQLRPQAAVASHTAFSTALPVPPVLTDQDITIHMQEADVPILPGTPTRMWTYDGVFPGPTIRRPSGTTTHVTFVNDLPASAGSTTVHHHGEHSASSEDGQPHEQLIPTGGQRTYTYDFMEDGRPERAAFQWYHDHRMDVTGRNVWMGLAGMVILDDPLDASLNLPSGDYDVPIMVADRQFDAANQIPYTFNATGVRGNHVLMNGAPQPFFSVGDRRYRLRLLNASNLASYEFQIPGVTMTQIATESGLLPAPVTRTSIRLGPAERAEIVVDFNGHLNEKITMINLLAFGPSRELMRFDVDDDVTDDSTLPSVLRPLEPAPNPPLVNTRLWVLDQTQVGELTWTINEQPFDPSRIDTDPLNTGLTNPKLGTSERWVFVNVTAVDHLIHIHDVDWRLIQRISLDAQDPGDALAEQGLKETFLIRPNEVMIVASTFTDHTGVYVFHCHILEHEDRAMMAQFKVVP